MTAEMQEIAITEEKPLLTGQADTAKVRNGVSVSILINVHSQGPCWLHAKTLTCMLIS